MFDTICNLPLTSDLFAQAIHPSEPLLAVGLAAGHVQLFRLPPDAAGDSSDDGATVSSNGCGQIETSWRTRRHKGSCRSLGFGIDGETLCSAGTDGMVKAAATETGQVAAKVVIPLDPLTSSTDAPTLLHVLSPQTLLIATDSSALHLYDLRAPTFSHSAPQQTHHPHDDYISSLTPLPPSAASTSGYSKQWVTTGGTTLAVTDLRRGVLVRSADQEDELLSSVFVAGLPTKGGHGKGSGDKVLVGGANGVLTLWERGVWDDQAERIIAARAPGAGGGESLDCLSLFPPGVGPGGAHVAVGLGDGRVRFVQLGANKPVCQVVHSELESVVALGFDVAGRLISGGGQVVKVWHEKVEAEQAGLEEGDGARAEGGEVDGSEDREEEDEEEEEDGSEEEERERKRRKRRKRNRGRGVKGAQQNVLAFRGLD
ncbi:WD repeat protein [Cryomyces antarcticus]|uniref:WD repeat-containing protein JIP5 n=1 Tax=Cryomyces antarcticus TaxID=329879 RepID=A0ABR0LZ81_9PEZI|nr:WD repeat-containing protein jip5 [Cryomyces antarcticus]KAK5020307.1 WD repeat-containing protein jip5 [Cryomyces antarcticus]KAK5257119.1 WD repeat-containing protein jip5 [Cryomyces antarcticus]